MDVAERLQAVRAHITQACRRSGRDPAGVTLVAVSKTHGPDAIREAYAAGQRDFGENYAQELRDKAAALADLDVRWHFIGRLQSNKAKIIAPLAWRVHALTEVRHAQALAKRAAGPVRCLVEVNLSGEQSKGGVDEDRALECVDALRRVPGIDITGLMTMPPWVEDPEQVAPLFRRLRHLARDAGLAELSMGMSQDFEVAVREGATLVRVGTAIFGPRQG